MSRTPWPHPALMGERASKAVLCIPLSPQKFIHSPPSEWLQSLCPWPSSQRKQACRVLDISAQLSYRHWNGIPSTHSMASLNCPIKLLPFLSHHKSLTHLKKKFQLQSFFPFSLLPCPIPVSPFFWIFFFSRSYLNWFSCLSFVMNIKRPDWSFWNTCPDLKLLFLSLMA